MVTIEELNKIMYYISAYLSKNYGCTYGKLVELLRQNVSGLEHLQYSDIYPVLFNVVADDTTLGNDENILAVGYDCDAVAKELFYNKGD